MNWYVSLKSLLALMMVSFMKVMTEDLVTDSFISDIGLGLLFWLTLFIFFDYRQWVKEK